MLEQLLTAHPEAAAVRDSYDWLPCHMVAGRHLTAAMQGGPLDRLLAANPPTAGWALRDLLALGVAGEASTLVRLASHPEEASAQAPVPYEEGSRDYKRLVRLEPYPYPQP